MGYHPGLEDDAFYLAAIKRNLNPALFPHDAEFFRLQFQATIFDKLIAFSVRVDSSAVGVGRVAVAVRRHLSRCFTVAGGSVAAASRSLRRSGRQSLPLPLLLTLPVSGIAMTLADQYLHPRTLATAAILAAIVAVLDRRLWLAGVLLAIAFAIHAIMAAFGISFCVFLCWKLRASEAKRPSATLISAAFLLPLGWVFPLGWIFEPASDAWRQAAATRSFYFLARWHWYEWLGVFAPLVLSYSSPFWRSRAKTDEAPSALAYHCFQLFFIMASSRPLSAFSSCFPRASSVCGPSSRCAICTCSICFSF